MIQRETALITAKRDRAHLPGRVPRRIALALLFCCLGASAGRAAVSLVQTATGKTDNGLSVSATYPTPPTEGNLLVAIAGNKNGSASPTLPAGWLTARYGPSNTPGQSIYYKIAGSAEPSVVTIGPYPLGFDTKLGLQLFEYAGVDRDDPLDTTNMADGYGTSISPGSLSTAVDGALVIVGIVLNASGAFDAWTGGFVERHDFANGGNPAEQSSFSGADLFAGSAGVYSSTATADAAGNWPAQIAAFNPATSGPFDIAGIVFEDADFAGSAANWDGGGADLALAGVDVELYDAAENYLASAITDLNGAYAFSDLAPGSYRVRARSATLGDTDTPPAGGLNANVPATWPYPLPELAWAHSGPLLGGQVADVDDTAIGDNAGSGDTYVEISSSGADISGVNFGFAYNLVVNVADDTNADNVRSRQGSLRQFLKNANAIGAAGGSTANTSQFHMQVPANQSASGDSWWRISPLAALPALSDGSTMVDGTTQRLNSAVDSNAAGPEIEIHGSLAGSAYGFLLISADNRIHELVVNGFAATDMAGIRIYGSSADRNTVSGCYLGTDARGAIGIPNTMGIAIFDRSDANTIGGTAGGDRNVISGNTRYGIMLSGILGNVTRDNVIEGNYIGTTAAGDAPLGNNSGIYMNPGVQGSIVGGTSAAARNVVSGNTSSGIQINGNATMGNQVMGNFIGTDLSGSVEIGNLTGITFMPGSMDNTIGGATPAHRNIIAGGAYGIQMYSTANKILGNYLGTDVTGTVTMGQANYAVYFVSSAAGNVLGGTGADEGNLIVNCGNHGIYHNGSGAGNRFSGNSIHSSGGRGIYLISGANNDKAPPVLDSLTPAGADFTVAATVLPGDTIEFFRANDAGPPAIPPDGSGAGEGYLYLGTCSDGGVASGPYVLAAADGDPASGSLAVTLLASGMGSGDYLTATASNSIDGSSAFALNLQTDPAYSLSGTVFEDVNYGGGSGRNHAAALAAAGPFGIERDDAIVELYDSNGDYVASDTTAGGGAYSFVDLAAGEYTLRVVNETVTSTRAGADGSEFCVQTYRADGQGEPLDTGASKVGGEYPADEDAAANAGAQPLSALQGTDNDFDGIQEWTQSIVTIDLSSGDVGGVDFGFNFDTIVNSHDAGQGTLRQFMENANLLTDNGDLAQSGLAAGMESSVFMIPSSTDPLGRPVDPNFDDGRGVAVLAIANSLPALSDARTVIDGVTQTSNIGDTNPGVLGYVGPVGLGADGVPETADEPTLAGVPAPEVEILGAQSIPYGLKLSADSLVVRGIAAYGFGSGGLEATILIGSTTIDLNNSGCILEQNVLGAPAHSFSDPGPAARSACINVYIRTADDGFVRNNLLGFVGRENIRCLGGTLNWQINDNEVRTGGLAGTFGGITLIADATGELHRNLIADDAAGEGILAINAIILADDNSITGNAGGGIMFWQNAGAMQGSGTITHNEISANGGSGVAVFGENGTSPTTTQVRIAENRFSANAGNAIDLAPDWTADGITVNDGTLLGDGSAGNACGMVLSSGNEGFDFPIIDYALLNGPLTTVAGRACPGSEVQIYLAVSDGDGSDTLAESDYGEGTRFLGVASADPGDGAFTLADITGLNHGDYVTALATDGSDNSSEFGANMMVTQFRTIAGVVFEDADFSGTAANWDGGGGDLPQPAVVVELYGSGDIFLGSTVTGANGAYQFSDLILGDYKIRVLCASLGDVDTPPGGGFNASVPTSWPYPLAEMSWGFDGALVGGQDPEIDDTATSPGAGPGDCYVPVTLGAAGLTGVNFGFSYELIVTEADDTRADDLRSRQGSLRQFIKNANAIAGLNHSYFALPSP